MNNIAIIVPFRIQKGQNREWELSQFIPHMKDMMDSLVDNKEIDNYHIYINYNFCLLFFSCKGSFHIALNAPLAVKIDSHKYMFVHYTPHNK